MDGESGSAQVELVGHPRGECVSDRSDDLIEAADLVIRREFLDLCAVSQHIVEQIGRHRATGEDAHHFRTSIGIIACAFERFPADLEEDAVLRIGDGRLAWEHPEELSVEHINVAETGA